jgi:hypothetical protein
MGYATTVTAIARGGGPSEVRFGATYLHHQHPQIYTFIGSSVCTGQEFGGVPPCPVGGRGRDASFFHASNAPRSHEDGGALERSWLANQSVEQSTAS